LLSLYINGEALFIKHGDVYSVDGTIKATIKYSSNDSFISQSIIEILTLYNKIQKDNLKDPKVNHINKTSIDNNSMHRANKSKQPLFVKDKVIMPIAPKTVLESDEEEIGYDSQHKSIEKVGFDIDTSF
jgi:hypothetical protein